MDQRVLVGNGRAIALVLVLAAGLLPTSTFAQPPAEPSWQSWGPAPGVDGTTNATTTWDPDGSGPLAAQLVVGGEFTTAGGVTVNGIARWDGAAWQPFGSGVNGFVRSLTTWDPDGSGPLPEQLVAGGSFVDAGGVMVNRVARWDGAAWQPLGSGMSDPSAPHVFSLATWDPDGSGLLPAQLVAGGSFTTAGGVTVNGIARWDGAAWQPFGGGMSGFEFPALYTFVYSLTTWDPDGPGPLPAQLVAGGNFTTAGGVRVNNIARWDGAAWQSFENGLDGSVYSLMTWDPDGAGPLAAQLVAGGSFYRVGGETVSHITRWDGAAWQPFGDGMSGGDSGGTHVLSLTTWDADGSGPLPAQLVAGGIFNTAGGVTVNGVARWDGAAWQPFGSGVDDSTFPYVYSLSTWDPDGSGPMPVQLVAGGAFNRIGGAAVYHIARWDGASWRAFGSGLNGFIHAVTTWDPDASGPVPAQLVVGDSSITAGFGSENNILHWDGSAWRPFGSGLSGSASPDRLALTIWDPDGPGPLPAQPVAGGDFFFAGSERVNLIARWDGAAWQPLGSGMNNTVFALTTWDPDGTGPMPEQVVAAGEFTNAGDVAVNRIAHWDGAAWQPFGSGMNSNSSPYVLALTTWDPDGSGPLTAQLVAGGAFPTAGGVTVNNIARWDGAAWQPFGSGVSGSVNAFAEWDPDGSGPLTAQLVAGGHFPTAGGVTVNSIARWDGAAWQPFGSGMNGRVLALTTWDADGPGPQPVQLAAAGYFTTAGGVMNNRIARWDGSAWRPFGSGMNSLVYALKAWDPDGSGPLPEQLIAGGAFSTAGGLPAGYLATWSTRSPLEPVCRGDFNNSGSVSVQDIFDFLGAYFAVDARADFNGDGAVSLQDVLDFLGAYFAGCS